VADDDDAHRLAAEQRVLRPLDDVEPVDVEPRLIASTLAIEPAPAAITLGWGIGETDF
jgi:hypothetical protein